VIRESVKVGLSGGEVWLEVHRPREDYTAEDRDKLWQQVFEKVETFVEEHPDVQVRRQSIEIAVDQADGIPTMIGEKLTQMASEKSAEPPQEQKTEPGQTLYF